MAAPKRDAAPTQIEFPFAYDGDTATKVTLSCSFDGTRTDVLYLPDTLPLFDGQEDRPTKGRLIFVFDDAEREPIREREKHQRPSKFGK